MTDLLPVADVFDALSHMIHAAQVAPAPVPDMATLMTEAYEIAAPFIGMEEGDRLKSYQDSGGHWTVGIGHTGPEVHAGMVITKAQEQMLFINDLTHFGASVLPLLTLVPGVGQYVALISLAFNIGLGTYATAAHPGSGFKGSSVLKAHNAGEFQTAAADFLLWDKAHVNGVLQEVPGLLARRKREAALYLGA